MGAFESLSTSVTNFTLEKEDKSYFNIIYYLSLVQNRFKIVTASNNSYTNLLFLLFLLYWYSVIKSMEYYNFLNWNLNEDSCSAYKIIQ